MSFKQFSTTHKAPSGDKPVAGKQRPLVDQPPAPGKAPAAAKPAAKP